MSSLELIITNAPPKSVRARYEKEGRGTIHGDGNNGKNVELGVKNNTGTKWHINGAKCTAEVKSVSSKQAHKYYKLKRCEWKISSEKNGNAKVDLHDLAVVIKTGCNKEQKKDRGKFYLEFKLIFADGSMGPTCCTHEMFDESCIETRRPRVKNLSRQCGVGGEEVWMELQSDITKTKLVEARLSVNFGGCEQQYSVKCQVHGNLVKFLLPFLYDENRRPTENMTMLQLKIVVDKNDDIASDTLTFGYLPEKYRRPNTDCNEEVEKEKGSRKRKAANDSEHSKTFDSENIREWSSPNEESSFMAEPKCMSYCSISEQPRTFPSSPKAFHEVKNLWLDEKVKAMITHSTTFTPHEVTLETPTCSKIIQETITFRDQSHNISSSLQSATVIGPEKQPLDEPKPCQQNLSLNTYKVQTPEERKSSAFPPTIDAIMCLLGEQEVGSANNSTMTTKETSMDPRFCYRPSAPNNTDLYHSEGTSFCAPSSPPPPLPIPVYHLKDPPISSPPFEDIDTHDGQSMNIVDLYQLYTTECDVGDVDFKDIDIGGTENATAVTTLPDLYAGHNHNPCSNLCQQPMEKVRKLG